MPWKGAVAIRNHDHLGRLLVALALAAVLLSNLKPLGDFDIYYHLAIGGWILDHHAVPRVGLFSATMGGQPWVDNEWGFQVLVTAWHRAFGIPGLVLLKALLVVLAAALLAAILRRRGVNALGVATALAASLLALGSPVLRPQVLTYVFLAGFLFGVIDLLEGRSRGPRIWLPLVVLFWANAHAGFILGLAAIFLVTATEGARRLLRRPPAAPLGLLATTATLCAAAAFVNPYGWRQVYYPLRYALEPAMTAQNFEWQPVVLSQLPNLEVLLGLVLALVALAPRRPLAHDVALLLAFTGLGLQAYRHAGLLAFVAPIAAARPIAACFAAITAGASAARLALLRVAALASLAAAILAGPGLPAWTPFRTNDDVLLPVGVSDFLIEQRPPGPLFNQYGDGGYLMWRFAPEAVVFVDGRNDLYPIEFMRDYFAVIAGGAPALAILDRYGVKTALLIEHPNFAALIGTLLDHRWVCVHRATDGFLPYLVLVREDESTREFIARVGTVELRPQPEGAGAGAPGDGEPRDSGTPSR